MVGVVDSVSFLNGFIDPNAAIFAIYSGDITAGVPQTASNFLINGTDPTTSLRDSGAPVVTNGTVTALGGITSTAGPVYSSALTSYTSVAGSAVNMDIALGNVFRVTCGANNFFLNAYTNGVAGARNTGQVVHVILVSSGTSVTITLGFNIRELASPSGITIGGTTGNTYTMSFVCDGTDLIEVSRTSLLTTG